MNKRQTTCRLNIWRDGTMLYITYMETRHVCKSNVAEWKKLGNINVDEA